MYIKCVELSAGVAPKQGNRSADAPHPLGFLLYNSLAEPGLVKTGADGTVAVGYICPFWAVMLSGREDANLVNMQPYCGEYTKPCPIGKIWPLFNDKISMTLPFLTNSRALIAGELLVLPYDGGSTQICSLPPPLDVQAHISQQSTLSTGELS